MSEVLTRSRHCPHRRWKQDRLQAVPRNRQHQLSRPVPSRAPCTSRRLVRKISIKFQLSEYAVGFASRPTSYLLLGVSWSGQVKRYVEVVYFTSFVNTRRTVIELASTFASAILRTSAVSIVRECYLNCFASV